MTGTFINAGAIILGSLIGLIFRSKIPEKYIKIVFQAIGLFTLFVGVAMSLKTQNYLIMVFSLVIGAVIGTAITLDKQIDVFAEWLKKKVRMSNEKFSEGLVTAFLLYCMGSMTILGAIEEGLGNEPNLLLAKSLMDGVSAIALSAALGSGVMFSVIPLLLYQGALTYLAVFLEERLSETIINELTAVGGLMLLGMGFNILKLSDIKVVNMLPALLIVVLLAYFFI